MTNTIIGKEEVREIVERIISNRREVIFLYDITNNNPNGDPNDENKVRMDNGRCMVTNVRLKRTGYWYFMPAPPIFHKALPVLLL